MKTRQEKFTIASHFEGKDSVVRETYDQLLKTLKSAGPIGVEAKKTSIHLMNVSALAGVATRKTHLVLTIKSDRMLKSPRIHRSERVSAGRYHHEVKLASPDEIDAELLGWLQAAYALSV